MCKLFNQYESDIRKYCNANSLDFDKVSKLPQSFGKSDIWVQYHDPDKGRRGLADETPAPIVLKISIKDGVAVCERTDYTDLYLKKLS